MEHFDCVLQPLLKYVLQRYHALNDSTSIFDSKPYDETITKVIMHSRKIKDETVDQLIMSLKSYVSLHSLQKGNEADLADDGLNTNDISSEDFAEEAPINLFGELSVEILKLLKSHSPSQILETYRHLRIGKEYLMTHLCTQFVRT